MNVNMIILLRKQMVSTMSIFTWKTEIVFIFVKLCGYHFDYGCLVQNHSFSPVCSYNG